MGSDDGTARLVFEECVRELDHGIMVKGRTCDSDSPVMYHGTDAKNVPEIRKSKTLRPGAKPYNDGSVNFTLNPNIHRFGSVRFVMDRVKVKKAAPDLRPMCYTTGKDDQIAQEMVEDLVKAKYDERGTVTSSNREHQRLGVESWSAYKNECKRLTLQPVPLKETTKALEYWVPWKPDSYGSTAGSNVSPCNAMWDSWSTGMADPVAVVRKEIAETRALAQDLGVPFSVKSCFAFASLNDHGVAPLDEKNLRRLETGEELEVESYYTSKFTARESPDGDPPRTPCLCPREEIQAPD